MHILPRHSPWMCRSHRPRIALARWPIGQLCGLESEVCGLESEASLILADLGCVGHANEPSQPSPDSMQRVSRV